MVSQYILQYPHCKENIKSAADIGENFSGENSPNVSGRNPREVITEEGKLIITFDAPAGGYIFVERFQINITGRCRFVFIRRPVIDLSDLSSGQYPSNKSKIN